jgi:hypothetical protein
MLHAKTDTCYPTTAYEGPHVVIIAAYGGGIRPSYLQELHLPHMGYAPQTKMPPSSSVTFGNNKKSQVISQLCGMTRHTPSRCYNYSIPHLKKTIQYLGIGNDNNDTEWKIPMVMVAA